LSQKCATANVDVDRLVLLSYSIALLYRFKVGLSLKQEAFWSAGRAVALSNTQRVNHLMEVNCDDGLGTSQGIKASCFRNDSKTKMMRLIFRVINLSCSIVTFVSCRDLRCDSRRLTEFTIFPLLFAYPDYVWPFPTSIQSHMELLS
jgi:hypothetical protein